MEADSARVITLRAPARKSSRKRTQLDYANLDSGMHTDPNRWTRMLEGKNIKENHFKKMKGADVGLEWLESDDSAMREPFIVETPDGLGMKMPDADFTVDDVAEAVGEDTPIEVIGKTPDFLFCMCIEPTIIRCRVSSQFTWMDVGEMGRLL